MSAKIYKYIFEISIWFLIGGFLLKYFGGARMFAGDLPVLVASAVISVLFYKKRIVNILSISLLPIIYLLMASLPLPQLIVFLLVWAYCIFITVTNRFVVDRGEFVDTIKRVLVVLMIIVIITFTNFNQFSISIQAIFPYLILAIISGVFLLRHLRAGGEMEQIDVYEKQQFIELTIFLLVCVLLTLLKAPVHILEGFSLLYHQLLIPLMTALVSVIGMLLSILIYLGSLLLSVINKTNKPQEVKFFFGEMIKEEADKIGFDSVEAFDYLPILYFIGATALVVIVFLVFHWLMGNIYQQSLQGGIIETRESLADLSMKPSRNRKKRPGNTREAVRYYYGKYMELLLKKQVELKGNDTTSEINDKYINFIQHDLVDKTTASNDLTSIYQEARYQLSKEISEDEVAKAKELYHHIKK